MVDQRVKGTYETKNTGAANAGDRTFVPKQRRLMLGAEPGCSQTAGAGGTSDLVTTPSATGGRTQWDCGGWLQK